MMWILFYVIGLVWFLISFGVLKTIETFKGNSWGHEENVVAIFFAIVWPLTAFLSMAMIIFSFGNKFSDFVIRKFK